MTRPERRQAESTRYARARAAGVSQDKEVSGRGGPGGGGSPRTGPSGPEIRPEITRDGGKKCGGDASDPRRRGAARHGNLVEKERMDRTIPPGGGGSIRNR